MKTFRLFSLILFLSTPFTLMAQLNPTLQAYVQARTAEYDQIAPERKAELQAMAAKLQALQHDSLRMVFICTHNSRRSHLGQVWAQVAAWHYMGPQARVHTYSGGTEATAFNSRAVAAVQRAGLVVTTLTPGTNPVYGIQAGEALPPMQAFSKKYDHETNPKADFVAVMVCTQADQACPAVPGASLRVALPYVDPKVSDGTPQEAATYDERCAQIAREMLYLFSLMGR